MIFPSFYDQSILYSYVDRMESMEEVVKMIIDLIDAVADVHLSPKAAAVSAKVRAEMNENKLREEHKERQEVGVNEMFLCVFPFVDCSISSLLYYSLNRSIYRSIVYIYHVYGGITCSVCKR